MQTRDSATPKDLMLGAWLISMFWAAGTLVAALRHDDTVIPYLAFTNLWVAIMWLGRYLGRVQR